MKFLKAGGFILILIFCLAGLLRVMYPPVPIVITNLEHVSGDLEAGNLVFKTRLPLFKKRWLQAIGLPDETPATIDLIHAYFDALQRTDEKVDIVISGSAAIDHVITGVQHAAVATDVAGLANLSRILHDALGRNLKVLLILSSTDATHRLPDTALVGLERDFGDPIPTIVFAGFALAEDEESSLVPACTRSPFSEGGQVSDLGCTILNLSKRAQVEKARHDQYLVSIEEESADEELVAIHRSHR